jgi:CHAD domain-containing protein
VACAHLPENARLQEILRTSENLRKQHQEHVQKILQSQDYQRFLLHFGVWLNGGYSRILAEGRLTLSFFAAQVLQRRSKQVVKYGKRLANFLSKKEESKVKDGAHELHLLRIACKKLRYSVEMFSSLYPDNKVRSYRSALVLLQDILGLLNDIAVARRLLGELEASVRQEAILLVHGWIEHDYMERLAELRKAWERFSREKTFW